MLDLSPLPYKYRLKSNDYSQLCIEGITLYRDRWVHSNKRNPNLDKYIDMVYCERYDPQVETLDAIKVINKVSNEQLLQEKVIDNTTRKEAYLRDKGLIEKKPIIVKQDPIIKKKQIIDGKPVEDNIQENNYLDIINMAENKIKELKPFEQKIIKKGEVLEVKNTKEKEKVIDTQDKDIQQKEYATKMVDLPNEDIESNEVIDLSNIEIPKE